jgi:predicted PurR-regulated permease PerM
MNLIISLPIIFLLVFFYLILVFNRLQQTFNNLSHVREDIKRFKQKTDSISQEKVIYSQRVLDNLNYELDKILKKPTNRLMLNFLKYHPEVIRLEKK